MSGERKLRWSPEAERNLRELWDVPVEADLALLRAAVTPDPVVRESHLAEARAVLEDADER